MDELNIKTTDEFSIYMRPHEVTFGKRLYLVCTYLGYVEYSVKESCGHDSFSLKQQKAKTQNVEYTTPTTMSIHKLAYISTYLFSR